MKLDNTVSAVVTGGRPASARTVRMLAAHGVKCAIFDLNEELGEKLAKEVGGVFCKVNVASTEDVDAGFAKARAPPTARNASRELRRRRRRRQDGVDRWTGKPRSQKEYPLDNFERIINVNLIGTFRCITKSAAGMFNLPVLPDGDRGAIVNTASVAAKTARSARSPTRPRRRRRRHHARRGARPFGFEHPLQHDPAGHFDTPLLARAPENVKAGLAAMVPHPKRLGRAEEYAQLAHTMITCGYFNGEDVRLDGAIRMAPR